MFFFLLGTVIVFIQAGDSPEELERGSCELLQPCQCSGEAESICYTRACFVCKYFYVLTPLYACRLFSSSEDPFPLCSISEDKSIAEGHYIM